eukprot:6321135-Amphidinium_carterae.1
MPVLATRSTFGGNLGQKIVTRRLPDDCQFSRAKRAACVGRASSGDAKLSERRCDRHHAAMARVHPMMHPKAMRAYCMWRKCPNATKHSPKHSDVEELLKVLAIVPWEVELHGCDLDDEILNSSHGRVFTYTPASHSTSIGWRANLTDARNFGCTSLTAS